MNRRSFVSGIAAVAAITSVPNTMLSQGNPKDGLESRLAEDPMRPQFHLLPARNWMNDPNAPIYFNGKYHMFFQYNPFGAVWGNMSWNHAVSGDMLHWTHEPLALTPTPGTSDAYGVFSGSAIAISKRVYAVYTGAQKSDDAHATIRDGANDVQESQCLAWSDDPRLVKWIKEPKPIIAAPPAGMAYTGFRDPSVWRQGEWYYMTVGSGVAEVGGCVLLYRSPVKGDLRHWEYLHTLTSGAWNGKKTANPCGDGEMWECPEFFALDGAHVLIYSTLNKVFWQSGVLDEKTMKFTPKKTGELDWGAFYAPKTQLDAAGQRILWGWIPERRSEDAMKAAGWSGMMSLPRVMNLDADGTLRLLVLPEAKLLRSGEISSTEINDGTTVTLPAAKGEVKCAATRPLDFELKIATRATELVRISYSAKTHAFVSDGREIVLEPGDMPSVHAFVDGSVIEMILGDRVGYTKRFYYDGPAPDVFFIATRAAPLKLDAWNVTPISNNRLTSVASG